MEACKLDNVSSTTQVKFSTREILNKLDSISALADLIMDDFVETETKTTPSVEQSILVEQTLQTLLKVEKSFKQTH